MKFLFQDKQVDINLNGIVLGESLLNDAVALVMANAIQEYQKKALEETSYNVTAIVLTIFQFLTLFLGSVLIGVIFSMLTALLTKHTLIKEQPLLETCMLTLLSYVSYFVAEVCKMSGIVAILFCGIIQSHYTFHNLSNESQIKTRQFYQLISYLSENFIFGYLGVSLVTFHRHRFQPYFILGALISIAVARALGVFPLAALVNLGKTHKLSLKASI